MRRVRLLLRIAILTAVVGGTADADAADLGDESSAAIEGGLTLIAQQADDDRIDTSLTTSLDVYGFAKSRTGTLVIYVEGNTTPTDNGVAELLPEVNGDAGSALDENLRGRLQVSELKYDFALTADRRLATGLVDLSAFLDTTRINNDENLQFLSSPLINNPAIEFPDYTLGLVFRQPSSSGRPEIHAALASSHGLADSPDRSYSELVDVAADGKGVFAAVEIAWTRKKQPYRLGLWYNGRAHEALDGSSPSRSNAGIWASAAQVFGQQTFNLRLGTAESDVAAIDRFASLAYQWDRGDRVLGVGLAHSHASGALADGEDAWQFETYLSLPLLPKIFLTPSLQQVWNSGLDSSANASRVAVFSLRLHMIF